MYYASRTMGTDDYVLAQHITASEQNRVYYCPCLTCQCEMKYRSMNSNGAAATFFKLPSSNHSPSCFVPYVKTEDGNKSEYEMSSFKPQMFLDSLLKPEKRSTKNNGDSTLGRDNSSAGKNELKPIKTVRQLYNICASNEPLTELNDGLRIVDVFAGRNTAYLYTRFINSVKLVECKYAYYNPNERNIYFRYPYGGNQLLLSAHFEDDLIFKQMRKQIYKYDKPILIYGDWDYSTITVQSKKQIVPLK